MQEETCHQRLEALFLTGLPTQWVWKKGKKKRKPSRGPGFAHTHIIQKAIFQVFLYILTLGKADLIYCMLLFPANPTLKSQGQQQNTFQEYNSCSDKRINNF